MREDSREQGGGMESARGGEGEGAWRRGRELSWAELIVELTTAEVERPPVTSETGSVGVE